DVVARYLYNPFGRLAGMWGALAAANMMRLSSMPSYDRAGIVGYPFRFYDPARQGWTSPDPIGEAGGINLYGFVQNNPPNLIDPYGLDFRRARAWGVLVPGPVTYGAGGRPWARPGR